MLHIKDLYLSYGSAKVLRGVSLAVDDGAIVSLIGDNAAGKTMALRAIAGLAMPTAGSVFFEGEDITKLPTHERIKRGIAFCQAEKQLFPEMSVRDNLEMGTYLHRQRGRGLDDALAEVAEFFPMLQIRVAQRAASLSGGEQKMLAIARALLTQPKLLLLDEPALGLSPDAAGLLAQIIYELSRMDLTILFTEQNAVLAHVLGAKIHILDHGKILENGRRADMYE